MLIIVYHIIRSMDALLKQYGDLKAQETKLLNEISKMALQDVNEVAAEIKVQSLEQKSASVKEFIIELMDKKIVIDKVYEKQYLYKDDYLKINFNLLYTLYMSNGGVLMSKTEMRGHLNILGCPKRAKTLCWQVDGLKPCTTHGYKLYRPKP